MSAQVYSVPCQTEERKKAFLEWANIDLSSKLSLACVGNVNYCKSLHHLVITLPVSSPLNSESKYITFMAKLKKRGLFWRMQERCIV